MGSSKKDFLDFPAPVKSEMGYALGLAQLGGKHPKAKHWKGVGPGAFEIVKNYDGDTYRGIYTVRFAEAVYVLHAFQKKSPSGIKTPKDDVNLVGERLTSAAQHYKDHYS